MQTKKLYSNVHLSTVKQKYGKLYPTNFKSEPAEWKDQMTKTTYRMRLFFIKLTNVSTQHVAFIFVWKQNKAKKWMTQDSTYL